MSWRDAYFYGRRTLAGRLGLIEAPKPASRSQAMADAVEEDRRAVEAIDAAERQMRVEGAKVLRQQRAEARAQAERAADAVIAGLLKTHDREVVRAFAKRHGYELPDERVE